MKRLFVPTFGASDWRRFLSDPEIQWQRRQSAYEMAVAWEAERLGARGIPDSVAAVLDSCPAMKGASLLLGLPEHKVELHGGGHQSQTDLWALLHAPVGVVSAAIEAKAGEGLYQTVEEWLSGASERSGKPARLEQLKQLLEIDHASCLPLRYQLMHRTASAILEARRFHLRAALILVQSFTDDGESLADFVAFAKALGASAGENRIVEAPTKAGLRLWIGWVSTPPAELASLEAAI